MPARCLAIPALAVALIISSCVPLSRTDHVSEQAVSARDAVIYEMFVRDFTPEGTFRAVIPHLEGLRELGVNVIWLMPIHPIGEVHRKGTLGSPYSIRDFFDVNPEHGTKEDFRDLVQAVHANGMRIILDFVANHSAWDNAWMTENPAFYTRDADGNARPPVDDWWDVADLDFDNPELRAEMRRAM
jgi:glycosidase